MPTDFDILDTFSALKNRAVCFCCFIKYMFVSNCISISIGGDAK